MKIIRKIIKLIIFLIPIVFMGCASTNPKYLTWDYNEYILSDYQNTPEWQRTDSILGELNTPEKVAKYLCENYHFYDIDFRRRSGRSIGKMTILAEAVPPPSRLVYTHGATCITTANFSRIALEKAGYSVEIMRMHWGDIKTANRSILTGSALIHIICIYHLDDGWYIIGDTFSGKNQQWCKIQGPWDSIQELENDYPHYKGSQWKIVTSQVPTYGHAPKKQKCRGVSCD